jgi:biopolymer transport protein ExbB/biopolymer transport protein TolQ
MEVVSELWNAMAFTGKTVVVILAVLSVYSYAVMVDRGLALRWARQRSARFAGDIEEGDLMEEEVESLLARSNEAEQQGHCSLATVISAGLSECQMLRGEGQAGAMVMEGVDEAIGRSLDGIVANLRVRLSGMATIVGVAPFLGLFGTVTGLIAAFRGIATAGGGGITEVSGGISEALVTTVIGLFVAMPALWAYNFFMNRIDVMALGLENNAARVVSHVVRRALQSGQKE